LVSMFAYAFFSRRLNPFLEGGEGNKNSVIAPESPTGLAIGRAVFGNPAYG